jgi:hypothetical protein
MRREYLWKKGRGYGLSILSGILLIPFLVLTALYAVLTITEHPFGCIFMAFFAWCTRCCWLGIKDSMKEADLPYVPPVTVNTLPAEEVLVRASVEPPMTQNEVLLRAAQRQETAKEELLRVAEE